MNNLITNKFLQYLISRNVSALTLKNYRSDLSYFSSWIINKINSIGSSCEDLQEALPFITKATASEYKDYLVKASVPAKTINRRLSTLRTLSKFFLEEDLLGFDFASGIENITSTPLAFPVEKSAKEFEAHLATEKISPVTIKNYTADINQFTRWTKNLGKKGMKDITSKDIKRYLVLEFSDAPQATTDRKTSSLKKFFNWAKEKQIIEVNPIDGFLKDTAYLKPLSRSLDELTTKKLERRVFGIEPSYKTIQDRIIARFAEKPQLQKVVYKLFYTRPKWYQAYHSLAITRYFHFAILVVFAASLGFGIYQQFFSKAKVQLAYPETPVTPNRYLSFQGRLTNQYNTPVTDSSTIKFELYDDETETGPTHLLWDSSDCEVVPDQDGIFNVLLGTTTGEDFSCPSATAIGADVFSENAGVWLQMTTETETMDPRVQIATVAYALNADTVQGFPVTATVSATKSSIVVMDKNGQVVLGEVGPTLKSVAGNFAIEGQTITLQTAAASNGDINISPNGTGSVNITSSAQSDDTLYITNAQTTTGALIHGYFGNDISSDVALLKIGVGTTEATVFSVDSEGDTTIASGADYHIGIIGLSDNGSSSSGASLIGLFDDDMDYVSGSPTVQSAIKQLDTAISGVSDASGWHDDGDIVRLVTSANRVGIGTTSVNASTKLGVLGAAAIGSQSYSDAAAPTNGLIVEGTVGIGVTASSNAKVEILQSNNTLYGLYVSNTGGSTGIYGFSSYGGNGTGVLGEGPTIGVSGAGTGSGTGVSGSSDSGIGVYAAGSTFDFYANTSSASNYFAGNVGIGTTTPLGSLDVRSGNIGLGTTMAPTQKLDIQGNMRLTGLLYDVNNQAGNDGQILSKTTTGVDWVDIGTIGISGTGTTNYVPRWASSSSLTNSSIYDDGANVGIGTTVPSYVLDVSTTSSLRTVNITSNVPATTSNLHGIYVYANDNDGTSSAANVYGGYFHANATGGAYEIAGVYGTAEGNSAGDWYGVWGQSESKGVYGQSTSGTGVYGQSTNYFGVFGAGGNVGVYAAATNFDIYAATPTAKNYFAGNVGIGITDPTQKLSVSGNVGVSTGVVIGANSESISIGATDDTIQVTRGGSTYTVCDSSGNCGSGTGATKWNGIQSPDGAQTLTMAAYNSTWNWATLNTGTALNFNVAALTTGVGIGITGGGTTALTSGNIISVTGPTGAAALSGAAGGVVNITASGAYTSTNNAGLLNLNAGTAAGVVQAITANSLTTGTGLVIASSGASQTSAKYIDIAQTGVTTGFTGSFINMTSSSTTGAANFIQLIANSSTLGVGEKISMTAITGGTGLSITGGSAMLAAGELVDLQMGAATVGAGLAITNSGAYTGTGLINITANTLSTGVAQQITTNAISSGTALSISTSSTAVTSAKLISAIATGSPASSWTGSLGTFEYTTSTDADIDGSALKVGITGAGAGSGTALNITSAQTAGDSFVFRANDDGTYTDSTPFVINLDGNVGIGTTAPDGGLVVGSGNQIAVQINPTSSTYYGIKFKNGTANAYSLFHDDTANTFDIGFHATATGDISTHAKLLTLNSSGNLGIGTSVPTKGKLNVLGSVAIGSTAYTETSGAAPTNGLIIEGNVGIGITNPIQKLQVSGTSAGGDLVVFQGSNQSLTAGTTTTMYLGASNVMAGLRAIKEGGSGSGGDGSLAFLTRTSDSTTEKVRITSGGNMGIGTTSPTTLLQVGQGSSSHSLGTGDTLLMGKLEAEGAAYFNSGIYGDGELMAIDFPNGTDNVYFSTNVGFGTTSPQTRVGIVGGVGIGTSDSFANAAIAANNLAVQGNVGIGISNPAARLDLSSPTSGRLVNAQLFGAGSNLLRGGSFENWGSSFSGMTQGACGGGDAVTITTQTGDAPNGQTVIQVAQTYAGGYCQNWTNTEYIAVQPSTTYTYSYWGKLISGTYGSINNMYVLEYNSSYASVINTGIFTGTYTSSWQYFTNTFTTSSTTAYIKVQHYNYSQGTAQFDGVSIQKGNVATEFAYSPTDLPSNTYAQGALLVSGNVGIGTTSPQSKLHVAEDDAGIEMVVGEDLWDAADNDARLFIGNTNDNSWIRLGSSASAYGYMGWIYNATAPYLYFNTSSDSQPISLQAPAGGNVGIGITNPTARLFVNGSIESNTTITTSGGSTTGKVMMVSGNSTNPGHFSWYRADGTTRMGYMGWATQGANNVGLTLENSANFIVGGGNMGLGITNPTQALTLNGGDIDFTRGDTSLIHSLGGISFDWTSGSYDNPEYHGIESKNLAGTLTSELRINSYGDLNFTIDSNANGSNTFRIQKESTTDGEDLLTLNETGKLQLEGYPGVGTTGKFLINYSSTDSAYYSQISMEAYNAGTQSLDIVKYGNYVTMTNTKGNWYFVNNSGNDFWFRNSSTTELLYIGSNVGVGTSSPGAKLDVEGYIQADMADVTSGYVICAVGHDGDDQTLQQCDGSGDIAEHYRGDGILKPGDITSGSNSNSEYLVPSSGNYDANTVGVISTMPAFKFGTKSGGEILLALNGRIPVKVAIKDISKPIKNNDKITASSLPGIGMKSERPGRVVAQALDNTSSWNESTCSQVSSLESISWPEDEDGTNSDKPCYRLPDGTYVGKIMAFLNVSWYDPDVYMASTGDLNIAKVSDGNYTVEGGNGTISRIGAFAQVAIANISAGAITTKELVVETSAQITGTLTAGIINATNITTDGFIAVRAEVDTLLVKTGLVSPTVQTAMISPLVNEGNINIQIGNSSDSSNGKLTIENQNGEEVASIDTEGNATFSGELAAKDVTAENTSTNTLTAQKIYADQIVAKDGKIFDLSATNITGVTREEIEAMLQEAEADQELLQTATNWTVETASQAAELANIGTANIENLFVTQSAAMNSLSLTTSLSLGSDMVLSSTTLDGLAVNSIDTLSAPLEIQSLAMAPVEIMAGRIKIDTEGNVTISGNLYVAGKIEAEGLVLSAQNSEEEGGSLLTLKNTEGSGVGSVSASGSAEFSQLASRKLVIAGAQVATASADGQGEITTNASAGHALLAANVNEITIKSSAVSDKTLVYVTPTTSTQNNVLFVKAKGDGYFKVGFIDAIDQDTEFNWWVIDAEQ